MASLFETNEILEVYYQTSDGQQFYKEHHAQTHAKTLDIKKVTKHTRAEYLASKNKVKKSQKSEKTETVSPSENKGEKSGKSKKPETVPTPENKEK